MPYSIFFLRSYAIHGSYEIKYLGRPASHGCVRLHPSNAAAQGAGTPQKRSHGERLADAVLGCESMGHAV
jgi:hypothetical protein